MSKLDVRRAITERGMKIEAFCKANGMKSQNLIQNVINGNPSVKKLQEIAACLHCDITELFYPEVEVANDNLNPNADGGEGVQEGNGAQNAEAQQNTPVQTVAFCPHCGAKVRVGVVLIED